MGLTEQGLNEVHFVDLLDFLEEVRKDTDRPASAIVDATVAWLFFPFINLKMHRTHMNSQTKYSFFTVQ